MKQNNSMELSSYSFHNIYNSNGSPDPLDPQIAFFPGCSGTFNRKSAFFLLLGVVVPMTAPAAWLAAQLLAFLRKIGSCKLMESAQHLKKYWFPIEIREKPDFLHYWNLLVILKLFYGKDVEKVFQIWRWHYIASWGADQIQIWQIEVPRTSIFMIARFVEPLRTLMGGFEYTKMILKMPRKIMVFLFFLIFCWLFIH